MSEEIAVTLSRRQAIAAEEALVREVARCERFLAVFVDDLIPTERDRASRNLAAAAGALDELRTVLYGPAVA